jgi:Sec-independent protein secretion pathway component TatC
MNELAVIVALAFVVGVLAVVRLRAWRWAMVGLICAIVAAIFPWPDPISQIILAAVFFLFFLGGVRFGRRWSVAAT